jgi:dihydroxy-acid dehydratase
MVCLGSCDKTTPAQLMAAARLDIPTLIAIGGYQASGELDGEHVDIEDVFLYSMHVLTGKMPVERLDAMSAAAVRSPGVCTGMGTANSMHIVCEALGMALPGSAPVRALSAKMMADVRAAGERIVQMVWDDLTPRRIMTPGAFANAVKAVLAVGGSVNCVKHLQATATEGEVDADVYGMFERYADEVPVLAALRPVGERFIEEFEDAGGCRALMKQLEPLLDTTVLTVAGRTVADNLRDVRVGDADVIRPLTNPVATKPAIVVLRGNLCPDTGIVKAGIGERKSRSFTGPAICFATSDDAISALNDKRIRPGHVVVMRGAGASGGPAMGGGASRIVFAIDGAGLGEHVAVLTDGHLSGLVCKGLVVAEVAPEAALGGPLALVQDGDPITVDLDAKRCDLDVDDAEIAARRARWVRAKPLFDRGWLNIYRRNVGPTATGAVLIQTTTKE